MIIRTVKTDTINAIKPWGEEHILSSRIKDFMVKVLTLKKWECGSLHLHKFKKELIYVVSGKLALISTGKNNKHILTEGMFIELKNNELHQLCAQEDTVLFECSTPDFNNRDVLRIADYNSRGHGRIEEEHKK